MPTVIAQTIVDEVEKTLYDDNNVRFSASELLGYLNDGQRNIQILRPDAYTKNSIVQLVQGTKQTIPADAIMLSKVRRNMGAAGTTAGEVPHKAEFEDIDNSNPNWHTATANGVVKNWFYDEIDKRTYYVSPPQPSPGHYLEIICPSSPPDVAIGAVISLSDEFKTPLQQYMLYRAYAKAGDHHDFAKSQTYLNNYRQELGSSAQSAAAVTE